MITLKEYEIYLKVQKFTETKICDENDIAPNQSMGLELFLLTFH